MTGSPPDSPSPRIGRVTAILFFVALAAGFASFGSTTALNDGYPLGLWIAFDVAQ